MLAYNLTLVTVTLASALAAPAQEVAMFHGGPAHGGVLATEAVSRPGPVRWEVATGGPVRSSPAVADGTVYAGSDDGRLYAVDLASGELVWVAEVGRPVRSAPAVDAERVYVVDHHGDIVAFGRSDGAPEWRVRAGPALPWAWGEEGWDYISSSPALAAGVVVAGAADGRVRAIDAASGELRWEVATEGRVRSSPAVADGVVFVGSADGIVRALDLATGDALWSFETAGASLESAAFGFDRRTVTGGPTVSGGRVWVGSRDASMYALDAATGERLWAWDDSSTAWVISTPAVAADRLIYGRSSSSMVEALDATTGRQLWEVVLGGPVFSSPAVVGDEAYVSTGGRGELVALDVATGDVLWRRALGAASWSSPTVADGVLVVGTDGGRLLALEAAAGATPRLAVFQDDALRLRSILGRGGIDGPLAEGLAARGFERLDSATLRPFLEARVADGAPSAVVFATDALPIDVAPAPEPSGLLQRYLDAGGKVVWVGDPPFRAMLTEAGGIDLDITRASAFTGVDHGGWVRDDRWLRVTPEGERWGLEGWWTGPGGVDPAGVTTVLVRDDEGRAVGWVNAFGGPEGTGWVSLPVARFPRLHDAIARVAEIGVTRRF